MLTRRVFLASSGGILAVAAAGGALLATGRLDDAARRAGLDPKPLSAPSDEALAATARRSEAALLATYQAVATTDKALLAHIAAFVPMAQQHLRALGDTGDQANIDIAAAPMALGEQVRLLRQEHSSIRASLSKAAISAVSGEFALVVASIAASHAQQGALLDAMNV
ncbi:hypothetical protein BH09ACT10_BH09ACT10_07400 [soil metagenome]